MLSLRGKDCALHKALGRLIGVECGVAFIAELVVFDLFNKICLVPRSHEIEDRDKTYSEFAGGGDVGPTFESVLLDGARPFA